MALESQGVYVRRESSVAGSTAEITTTNAIGFDSTDNKITRQAGFADFSTGMRVECNATLNSGIFTISATEATAIVVYETITDQASGSTVALIGHAMQAIGEVVSFNGPALTGNLIDVTHLQSTAKEKIPGLHDAGQMSISVNFDNEASNTALHDALERDLRDRTLRKFDIKFTDEGSVSSQPSAVFFSGYVSGFNVTGSVDNALKADITVAITSGVYWVDPV